jgi:CBS domain-containing protein
MPRHRLRSIEVAVRRRRTLTRTGEWQVAETVHCPRHDAAVSLPDCLACGACVGLRTAEDTVVGCRDGVSGREQRIRGPTGAARTPVTEVMSGDLVCVQPGLDRQALTALLVDLGIGGAPVVDSRGRPIGVVSKSDLLRADLEGTPRATVADLMIPIAFTLPENASLSHAAALMTEEGVHRVPVVATDGSVIGVVTSLDVVRWLAVQDGHAGTRLAPRRSERTT